MAFGKRSRIANTPYTAPPGMQEFLRQLIADNQELRNTIIALQSQVTALSRRR